MPDPIKPPGAVPQSEAVAPAKTTAVVSPVESALPNPIAASSGGHPPVAGVAGGSGTAGIAAAAGGAVPAAPQQFSVQGRVLLSDRTPLVGATVVAFDQDLRGTPQPLGAAGIVVTTDSDGHYEIPYTSDQFASAEKGTADLVVHVLSSASIPLAQSRVQFNAPAIATVPDLTVDARLPGIPSEYERLIAELTPLLVNVTIVGNDSPSTIDRLADLKAPDLDFLVGETEEPRPKLEAITTAAVLQKQAAAEGSGVPAMAFYGLAREGLPLDLTALLLRSDQQLSDALAAAIDANIIPKGPGDLVVGWVQNLRRLLVQYGLTTAPAPGTHSIGSLLGTAALSTDQQRAVLMLSVNHTGAPEDFWTQLRAQPAFQPPGVIEKVQLSLQLGLVTQNHVPLVQGLLAARITSTRDLVTWDASAWLKLINQPAADGTTVGVPPGVPGATPDEQALSYANGMASIVEATFPTETMAHLAATTPSLPAQAAVARFFANSPDFDIRNTKVRQYTTDKADAAFNGISEADKPVVIQQVNRLQRVFQLSQDASSAAALLATGLSSAHAIAKIPQRAFLAQYSQALGGADTAATVYQRAQVINARVLHILSAVQDQVTGVQVAAISGAATAAAPSPAAAPPPGPNAAPMRMMPRQAAKTAQNQSPGVQGVTASNGQPQAQADLLKVLPNYAELFGSLDLCQCSDCRSVLSPAAYLVDLFEFLLHSTPNAAGKTPRDVLFGRRPDLPLLPLSCENTNVALPYLDLVNEVLESYVALTLSKGEPLPPFDTGDATTPELNASPQYTNDQAYVTLQETFFPPTLPFNQPIAATRAYLENLGTSRYEVVSAFQKQQTALAACGIAAEYLKISREEFQIVTKQDFDLKAAYTPHNLWELYGYASASTNPPWEQDVAQVPQLLQRLAIAYPELVQLVTTTFINPGYPQGPVLTTFLKIPMTFATLAGLVANNFPQTDASLVTSVVDALGSWPTLVDWCNANFKTLSQLLVLDAPDGTCDLDTTVLVHLDGSGVSDAELDRLHRFVRLYRKLGWSIVDLDCTLAALGATDITADVLVQLASVQRLQASLTVPDRQVLFSLWAPTLNTRGDDALYTKLFLNKAAPGPDPAFLPKPDGSLLDGSENLSVHAPALLSALRISAVNLTAVRADAGLDADTTPLTLANVTTLHRYAAAASLLRMRIPELLALKALTVAQPFASPSQTELFQGIVSAVAQSGLSAAKLSYLYRHLSSPPATLSPPTSQVRGLALALHAGLTAIVDDDALATGSGASPDPTGEVSRAKLLLLFDKATTEQAIGMINGTAAYVASLAALPTGLAFPASVSAKVSFDSAKGVLRFLGAMSTPEQTDLLNASNDAPYQSAVSALYLQPLTFLQNTFSGFVDANDAFKHLVQDVASLDSGLNPTELDQNGQPTTDAAQAVGTAQGAKFADLLAHLLPYLTTQLSHAFVKQSLAGALKLDSDVAQVLIETALKSLTDGTKPVIGDFLALATSGLTPSYFSTTAPTATPSASGEPAAVGAAPGIPAGMQSATWAGLMTAPTSGSYTFSVVTNAQQPQLWLDEAPVPLTQDVSTKEWATGPISLKASQVLTLRLELDALPAAGATAELLWQSASVPKVPIPAEAFLPAAQLDVFEGAFTRLQKAALLIDALSLTAAEVTYFALHSSDFGGFDFNALPLTRTAANSATVDQTAPSLFAAWQRINSYVVLRDGLPGGPATLLDVFGAKTIDDALAALVQATGWDAETLSALCGTAGLALSQPAFTNEIALVTLQTCFGLIQRLGVPAAALFSWADLGSTFATLQQTVVPDIKKAVRGKYDQPTWLTVSKSINDSLRQAQRDALVAYLLPAMGLTDADQLFEYFLIDPEMCACMETSRIKQAISSVQLFVQRVLLHLEERPDVPEISVSPSAIDAKVWSQWKGQIGPWRANREIFLYPENWLESSLRDDKSPPFKDLEAAFLQNEITSDNAHTHFEAYLTAVDQIKSLEICAMYWEDFDPETKAPINTLHVFGRTRQQPRTYFYRRRLNNTVWTPWEKISASVEGDHLIPVVWNRRLVLYWATFAQKAETPTLGGTITLGNTVVAPSQYLEIALSWSEYSQGKWTPKQIADSGISLTTAEGPDPGSLDPLYFKFTTEVQSDASGRLSALLIHCEHDSSNVAVYVPTQKSFHPRLQIGTFRVGSESLETLSVDSQDPGAGSVPVIGFENLDPSAMILTSSTPELAVVAGAAGPAHVILKAAPGDFRVLAPHQYDPYHLQAPFFFQDDSTRVFLAVPTDSEAYLTQVANPNTVAVDKYVQGIASPNGLGIFTSKAPTSPAPPPVDGGPVDGGPDFGLSVSSPATAATEYWAQKGVQQVASLFRVPRLLWDVHYHPFVTAFSKALARDGVPGLLSEETQTLGNDGLFQFAETYQPDPGMVVEPYPIEDVDFRYGGSHSLYNWETFFYAPLLIATTLSANQRFEEAMEWFHYIFFPMDDSASEQPPGRYWKFLPFKDVPQTRLVDMLSKLDAGDPDLEAQIQDWTQNPFAPFRIARLRWSAFQKNVFMKYLANLIAWADQLFIRDTIESINQATQLYILAAHLLGKRGERVPLRTANVVETYAQLAATKLDSFGDALVTLENAFPFTTGVVASTMGDAAGLLGVSTSLYFCVPENDKLLGYWDTVADRLFKIRNCMNIQGVVQQLPLFEPPIDPALLVQAAAQGADLASILNDISAPMPYYRFSYMLQKALELCAEVRSLGAALLAALEKGDAEALTLLRATQETNILGLMQQMKSYANDEAENQWLALTASQKTAFSRYSYYQQMFTGSAPAAPADGTDLELQPVPSTMGTELSADSTSRLLAEEQSELDSSQSASAQQGTIEGMQRIIALWSLIPNTTLNSEPMGVGVSVTWGSQNLIESARGYVGVDQTQATESSYDAAHAGKMAGYYRRQLEWTLQSNLAAGEFNQLNRQLLAAKIRFQMASYELNTLYPKQLQNAQALQDAYANKYTNQELYSWMGAQIGTTYFQCYNLAYRQAKMAEQTFRYQTGVVDSSFIRFGYWDSFRKGLQSGEQLYLALKQLESAYQDQNKREFEITKRVSLVLLDPFALISLKETGQCAVTLPEALFDVDYPGHYMRRIKSVSLTIPCVTGPYTSVNCTMTLLKSKTRLQAAVGAGYAEQDSDPRFAYNFAATDSIATSTAENDSGMFEVSFHDERYLPFEGSGAVSEWRLDMPKDNNAFDFETITDVVLNLLYTARDGGDPLRRAARNAMAAAAPREAARFVSVKHEFPSEWRAFLHPPDATPGQSATLALPQERFPFLLRGKSITVDRVDVFLLFKAVYKQDAYKAKDPTPLRDYANGKTPPLNISVTPPGSSALTAVPLRSVDSFFGGVPSGWFNLSVQPASLGAWQLQLDDATITSLPASLKTTVKIGSTQVDRVLPDVLEDLVLVLQYSAT